MADSAKRHTARGRPGGHAAPESLKGGRHREVAQADAAGPGRGQHSPQAAPRRWRGRTGHELKPQPGIAAGCRHVVGSRARIKVNPRSNTCFSHRLDSPVCTGEPGMGLQARHDHASNGERAFRSPRTIPPAANLPFLSVLVAAKDEEANIETCVRTMLEQDYPNFELIVSNDRSTDRTAEIVEQHRRRRTRACGWSTSSTCPRAGAARTTPCRPASQQAAGEWICMIDADCRQTSPRTLCVGRAVRPRQQGRPAQRAAARWR